MVLFQKRNTFCKQPTTKMPNKSEAVNNILASTSMLHTFCNACGYASCVKKHPTSENLFLIFKLVMAFLSVETIRNRLQDALNENSDAVVYLVAQDILNIMDKITYMMHALITTLQAQNIRKFWEKLRAIERDLNDIDIKLHHKYVRVITIVGVVPEYLSMSMFLSGFIIILANSATLEQLITNILIGKEPDLYFLYCSCGFAMRSFGKRLNDLRIMLSRRAVLLYHFPIM